MNPCRRMLRYEFDGRSGRFSPVSVTTSSRAQLGGPANARNHDRALAPAPAKLGQRAGSAQPPAGGADVKRPCGRGRVAVKGDVARPPGATRQAGQVRPDSRRDSIGLGDHPRELPRQIRADQLDPQAGLDRGGIGHGSYELDPRVPRRVAPRPQHPLQLRRAGCRRQRDRMHGRAVQLADLVEILVGGGPRDAQTLNPVEHDRVDPGCVAHDRGADGGHVVAQHAAPGVRLGQLGLEGSRRAHFDAFRAGMYPSFSSQCPPSMVKFSPVT